MLRSVTQRSRITWWNVRRAIKKEVTELSNPHAWERALLMPIDNKLRMPKNNKRPMIREILKAFEEIPSANLSTGYLSAVFHDADVREHQGTGERIVFMRGAFGELKSEAERKLLSSPRDQIQVRSKPFQLELFPTQSGGESVKSAPVRTAIRGTQV